MEGVASKLQSFTRLAQSDSVMRRTTKTNNSPETSEEERAVLGFFRGTFTGRGRSKSEPKEVPKEILLPVPPPAALLVAPWKWNPPIYEKKGTVKVWGETLVTSRTGFVETSKAIACSITDTCVQVTNKVLAKYKIEDDPSLYRLCERVVFSQQETMLHDDERPLEIQNQWVQESSIEAHEFCIRKKFSPQKVVSLKKQCLELYERMLILSEHLPELETNVFLNQILTSYTITVEGSMENSNLSPQAEEKEDKEAKSTDGAVVKKIVRSNSNPHSARTMRRGKKKGNRVKSVRFSAQQQADLVIFSFFEFLRDGIALCTFLNVIHPGAAEGMITEPTSAVLKKANVMIFLAGLPLIDLPQSDNSGNPMSGDDRYFSLFQLFSDDESDLLMVLNTVQALVLRSEQVLFGEAGVAQSTTSVNLDKYVSPHTRDSIRSKRSERRNTSILTSEEEQEEPAEKLIERIFQWQRQSFQSIFEDPSEFKYRMIINELERTEKGYVADLEVLLEEKQLYAAQGLPVDVLFSNIEEILQCNREFYMRLNPILDTMFKPKEEEEKEKPEKEEKIKEEIWGTGREENDIITAYSDEGLKQKRQARHLKPEEHLATFAELMNVEEDHTHIGLASLFADFSSRFEAVYTPYSINHPKATAAYHEKLPKLRQLHKEGLISLEPTLRFPGYLIKPVQRILKYPLLLQELVNASESFLVRHSELLSCLTSIRSVTSTLNEVKSQQESKQVVGELETRCVGLVGTMAEFGRLWVDQVLEEVKLENKATKKLHCFLFQHQFIAAKEVGHKKRKNQFVYEVRFQIPLQGESAKDLTVVRTSPLSPGGFCFCIILTKDGEQVARVFRTRSKEELEEWMNRFSALTAPLPTNDYSFY
eukprot:Lithocolla_globosa_v1_NODE_1269_length_2714_cov_7.699135.p1 type:complete len:876 gc:universal NODE_1269_length_2714_cov_7.699135:2653-26(-)